MSTKKWIGLAMLVGGGFMFWKREQTKKQLGAAVTAAITSPFTETELEQFSPITFSKGEVCPR